MYTKAHKEGEIENEVKISGVLLVRAGLLVLYTRDGLPISINIIPQTNNVRNKRIWVSI